MTAPDTNQPNRALGRARKKLHLLMRFFQLVLSLLLSPVADSADFNEVPDLQTRSNASAFMQAYYLCIFGQWIVDEADLQPRPEFIGSLIHALHSTGYLKKSTAAPPVIGFFSEIFAENRDRLADWRVLIAKEDKRTKAALTRALSLSNAGGVLKIDGHSAELNDNYWGAFFASGNSKFIKKLIDQLRYFDERDDPGLFFAAATAKWSLASNAQSHPRVRVAIEEAKLTADKRTQELITELLG